MHACMTLLGTCYHICTDLRYIGDESVEDSGDKLSDTLGELEQTNELFEVSGKR